MTSNNDLSSLYPGVYLEGFPGGASGKELTCQSRRPKRLRFNPLGWEDPPEKEVAVYSSILAWDIPRTEESSVLQSTGSQKAGRCWSDLAHLLRMFQGSLQ